MKNKEISRITLRLPKDLHETISKLANKNNRSLNNEIVTILEYYLLMEEIPEELLNEIENENNPKQK